MITVSEKCADAALWPPLQRIYFRRGHVEVSAEHKRARAPVCGRKRMHIAHAAAPVVE